MPDPISDSAITAALRRQMTLAAAQELVSAGTLANLSTPGYRAREAFEAALGEAGIELAATDPAHLAIRERTGPTSTREVTGLAERRDGNNVQLDRELLTMATASADFKAAQTALAAKFRLVRYALSESR